MVVEGLILLEPIRTDQKQRRVRSSQERLGKDFEAIRVFASRLASKAFPCVATVRPRLLRQWLGLVPCGGRCRRPLFSSKFCV